MSNNEVWRDIEGREGFYQVSNLGRVRSLDRQLKCGRRCKGKILKPGLNPGGYLAVGLRPKIEGLSTMPMIHRLVATAFIENPDDLPEVNHKDGVRSNNTLKNLEWVDRSENIKHSYRCLVRKKHVHSTPVRVTAISGKVLNFESFREAGMFLGRDAGSVNSAVRKGHLCAGYLVELAA